MAGWLRIIEILATRLVSWVHGWNLGAAELRLKSITASVVFSSCSGGIFSALLKNFDFIIEL